MFKENLRLIFVAYTKVEAAYTKDMNLESTLRSP